MSIENLNRKDVNEIKEVGESPEDKKVEEVLNEIKNPEVSDKGALETLAIESLKKGLLKSKDKEEIKRLTIENLNYLYDIKGKTYFNYVMITKMIENQHEPIFEEIMVSHQAYIDNKSGVEHGTKNYDEKSGEVIDQRSTVVEYEGFNMISRLIDHSKKIENEDFDYEGMNHRLDVGKHIKFLMDQDNITEDELGDPVELDKDHLALSKFLKDDKIDKTAKKYMIIQKLAGGNKELSKISEQLSKIEINSSDYDQVRSKFLNYESKAEEILKNYLEQEDKNSDNSEDSEVSKEIVDEKAQEEILEEEDLANEILISKIEEEKTGEVEAQKEKIKNEVKKLVLSVLGEEVLANLEKILETDMDKDSLNEVLQDIFSENGLGSKKIDSATLKSLSRIVKNSELGPKKSLAVIAMIEGVFREILKEDENNISGEEGNDSLSELSYRMIKNINKKLRLRVEIERSKQE